MFLIIHLDHHLILEVHDLTILHFPLLLFILGPLDCSTPLTLILLRKGGGGSQEEEGKKRGG